MGHMLRSRRNRWIYFCRSSLCFWLMLYMTLLKCVLWFRWFEINMYRLCILYLWIKYLSYSIRKSENIFKIELVKDVYRRSQLEICPHTQKNQNENEIITYLEVMYSNFSTWKKNAGLPPRNMWCASYRVGNNNRVTMLMAFSW